MTDLLKNLNKYNNFKNRVAGSNDCQINYVHYI